MLQHTTIVFNLRKKKKRFDVIHNLDEYSLDIEAAFENWWPRVRNNNFSIESFCEYVTSKDVNLICKPKK